MIYSNISEEDLREIRSWVIVAGESFHRKVRNFLSRYDLDYGGSRRKTGGRTVMVGTFSWSDRPSD